MSELATLSPPPHSKTAATRPTGSCEPALPQALIRWHSQQLMQGQTLVEIVHGPAVYRLRMTAAGKLILTK